ISSGWGAAPLAKGEISKLAGPGRMRQVGRMFDPLEKLKEFIRHKSISADPAYADGMRGAQGFVSGLLADIGFEVEVVATKLHPIILARRGGNADWPHVIIYGHYD